jgi:surface antigen/peptidoglycan hydrolase CwlO-like protein
MLMFIRKAYKTKMKLNISKKPRITRKTAGILTLAVAAVFAAGSFLLPTVANADRFDEEIRALQNENANKQGQLDALKIQASSYQDAINQLQAQINAVQAQINENQAKQADLQTKIAESQAELEKQKGILGENIRVMYVEGQISTIEMLATSKNLSDFVDKEEYRTAVKNKIQLTLKQIAILQNQLNEQKTQVERLLAEQKAQQNQLAYSRAEQSRLLSYNKSQQSDYSNQMEANSKKIAELKEQQAIENARLFGGSGGTVGGGGYPWGYAKCIHTGAVEGKCPNYDWAVNGNIWNYSNGGYGYRNCTDWVAWRTGAPGGLGNANQWDDRAGAMGYTVSSTPRKGSAAVSNAGTYGHVMYVESVEADGSIIISDYNRAGTGLYSTATLKKVGEGRYRNSSSGSTATLVFVYL